MTLWLFMVMLCSVVAVAISVPLIRRFDAPSTLGHEAAFYHDQIKEVDQDVASGMITPVGATTAKVEINRRMAAAAKKMPTSNPVSNRWRMIALVATAGWVIVGGTYLYGKLGRPQFTQQAQTQTQADASTAAMIDAMVAKLQGKLDANPNDAQGWRMMGLAQMNLQHFDKSIAAYEKAITLEPDNIETQSRYVEALVQQAQGTVTPKATTVIAMVLAKQPKDLRARYYEAIGTEQTGKTADALAKWQALLADAPADAPWLDTVKEHVAALSKK